MLLDTDVLLDVALDREPHVRHSAELPPLLGRRPPTAFVACHSLSNFHDLVRDHRSDADAGDFLSELTRLVTVAPSDGEAFRYASDLDLKDFDDALQVGAARAVGADRIVTRNVRDYRESPIPAVEPKAAVEWLGSGEV